MLEAFRASARADAEPKAPSAASPADPPRSGAAGGPFAPAKPPPAEAPAQAPALPDEPLRAPRAPREEPSSPKRPGIGVPLSDEGLVLPMGAWTFVGAQLALLAFVFLLGRLSAGDDAVQAGDPATPSSNFVLGPKAAETPPRAAGAPRETAAPLPVDQRPRTDADAAFLARENRFSVVAITLPTSELGRGLAQETYSHLQELGFEVVTPRVKGSHLVVLVGAAPTSRDLEELERRLRATRGPGGEGFPYATAYRVNIEDYL